MSIRLIILSTVLSFVVSFAIGGPAIGSTSEWGIVISPCKWCERTNDIEVHHIITQAECKRIGRPDLIYNTNNMVCLCRTGGKGCHFYIGHHGVRWDYVFTNVMAVIRIRKTKE